MRSPFSSHHAFIALATLIVTGWVRIVDRNISNHPFGNEILMAVRWRRSYSADSCGSSPFGVIDCEKHHFDVFQLRYGYCKFPIWVLASSVTISLKVKSLILGLFTFVTLVASGQFDHLQYL